jgi:hypothetical protein
MGLPDGSASLGGSSAITGTQGFSLSSVKTVTTFTRSYSVSQVTGTTLKQITVSVRWAENGIKHESRSRSADKAGGMPAWRAGMQQQSGNDAWKCGDESGTVLMVVLVSLLVTLILGIVLIKSSVVESRIAGNDLKSQKDFYACETAGEVAVAKIDDILSTVNLDTAIRTIDISSTVNGTGPVKGASVTLTYLKTSSPQANSGNGRTSPIRGSVIQPPSSISRGRPSRRLTYAKAT